MQSALILANMNLSGTLPASWGTHLIPVGHTTIVQTTLGQTSLSFAGCIYSAMRAAAIDILQQLYMLVLAQRAPIYALTVL